MLCGQLHKHCAKLNLVKHKSFQFGFATPLVIAIVGVVIVILVVVSYLLFFSKSKVVPQPQPTETQTTTTSSTPKDKAANDVVIFYKTESWGPCPQGEVCTQSTMLFSSGTFIQEGSKNIQKKLPRETVDKVKSKIESSGIMDKDCPAQGVIDYYATYQLVVGHQVKTIQFPGCEDILKEIEQLIPLT